MKKEYITKAWLKEICAHHKQKNKELGYIAWFNWADALYKKKIKQSQCPKCGFWLFPEEMAGS